MLQIILIVVGIIVLIGVLGAIIDFIKEHPLGVIWVIAIIASIFIMPIISIVLAVVFVLFALVTRNSAKSNETKLRNFLESNCKNMGCLAGVDIKTIAPKFSSKNFGDSSYDSIVKSFIEGVENQMITNDKELTWLAPGLSYIEDNGIADVYELERIVAGSLRASHFTPNGKLVCDAMKGLCATKIINGKHKYSKIPLNAEDVKRTYGLDMVPDYYLLTFKLEDTSGAGGGSSMGNIETEELSLEDLGIDMD